MEDSPKTPFGSQSSVRIQRAWPAVVDNVLNKYATKVRFNFAPGAPFYGMSARVQSEVTEVLQQETSCEDLSRYGDVLGTRELRRLWANIIIQGYSAGTFEEGSLKDVDDIMPHHELMITAGANQAFMNVVLALCDAEDEVLLILPYYFSHYNTLAMTGVTPVCVPVDRRSFLPNVSDIKKRITTRSRALVLVNPGNPSGKVLPRSLIDHLVDLCQKTGIWLVIDEAYREFNFESTSRLSYSPKTEDGIIHIYTASKAYGLAGWRIGAVQYPKSLSDVMRKAQDTIPTHAAKFSELVALKALRYNPLASSPSLPSHILQLGEVRNVFIRNLREVYKESVLTDLFVVPNGAFYFFLPYNTNEPVASEATDMEVVDSLALRHGVLTTPGFTFGMPGYIRISYGCIPTAFAEEAAEALVCGLSKFV